MLDLLSTGDEYVLGALDIAETISARADSTAPDGYAVLMSTNRAVTQYRKRTLRGYIALRLLMVEGYLRKIVKILLENVVSKIHSA